MPSSSSCILSTPTPNIQRDSSLTSQDMAPGTAQHKRGVDAFPAELLCEIFQDIVTAGFSNAKSAGYGFKGIRAPWNISAVCSSWRRACLANAKLWTYIVVRWHHCPHDYRQRHPYDGASIFRIDLQLKRSNGLPLHIDASNCCETRYAFSLLRAVAQECYRWKSVNFYALCREVEIRSFMPANPKLPLLEEITWDLNTDVEEERFSCPFTFTGLTNLRSAKIRYFNFQSAYPFPWSQLTHLHFIDVIGGFTEVLDTMAKCTALTHFKLSLIDCHYSDPEDSDFIVEVYEPDSIILQNLASLDFSGGCVAASAMLPTLRLPNLCRLAYEDRYTDNAAISSLVSRSSCSLRELTMHIENREPDTSVLNALPDLQSLTIRDNSHPTRQREDEVLHCDAILRDLIIDVQNSMVLCPRLQHLELHHLSFDPVLLIQVVRSRQASGDATVIPLRSITVSMSCVDEPPVGFYEKVLVECLQKEALEGLQLHFRH